MQGEKGRPCASSQEGATLAKGGEGGSLLPHLPWNSLAMRWQHLTVHLFSEGESQQGPTVRGLPREGATSPPGQVSVNPFPDENGCPSTHLLASRPAVCLLEWRLMAMRTVFLHLWAT